jgi:serine/threonine protein kinase
MPFNCLEWPLEIVVLLAPPLPEIMPSERFEKEEMGPVIINGRYEVLAELGRGGMGIVYRAKQKSLNRRVAIKMLSRDLAGDSEFCARFQQEAEVIARLQHENIVTVYDIEQDRGTFFIIMEYVQGVSLQKRIANSGELSAPHAARLIGQVARALGYAHKKGIVHRDIKPDNIMIVDDDKAMVMDFGIARVADSTLKTQTGVSMGTPKYMSPEQARGKKVDHRSDLYSLGVVLYTCLTAELPFDGDSPFTIALKHMQEPPPLPSEKVEDLPEAMEKIVLRAMAKDPGDRFQSGEEFAAALDAAVAPISQAIHPASGFAPTVVKLAERKEDAGLAPAGTPSSARTPPGAATATDPQSEPIPAVSNGGYPPGTSGDTGRLSVGAAGGIQRNAASHSIPKRALALGLIVLTAGLAAVVWTSLFGPSSPINVPPQGSAPEQVAAEPPITPRPAVPTPVPDDRRGPAEAADTPPPAATVPAWVAELPSRKGVYFGDAAGEVRPPVEEASAKFSGARMSFTSAAEEGVPLTAAGLNSVADAVASALDSILQAGQEISPREIQLTAIRVRGLLAAIQESSPADLPRLYESLKARNLVYVEILEGLR